MPAWKKIRNSYPALKKYVYLDTAGTGVMSNATARAAKQFYDSVNRHGNVELAQWLERMREARREVASLIGATPAEVAFVPNTSHGINIAALMLKDRGEVVTNDSEFPSSTVPWLNQGYKVRFVRARKGVVHLEDMKKAMGRRRKGVIVHSYVQYASGFRQDMVGLGRLARQRSHYFVANITQGCGAFPVDVKKWGADFACCTGIKWLCAGEGAGFMYIRTGLLKKLPTPLAGWFSVKKPLRMDNRATSLKDEAARFELGGSNMPNIFALGNSVKEIRKLGVENIAKRIYSLTDYLIEKLKELRINLASPADFVYRSGIVLLKVAHASMLVEVLRNRGVCVTARGAGLRVSLHFYNCRDDIDRFLYHLRKFV
jgi:selenocysteine lyase/cysteine desulfurase